MKNLVLFIPVFTVLMLCHNNKLSDQYRTLYYDVYFSDTNAGFLQSSLEKDGSYRYVFDEAWAKAFNPNIQFTRTKTLMEGHACCDHCYKI